MKEVLSSKTLAFWKVSQCWNDVDLARIEDMNVLKALTSLREIGTDVGPHRPLSLRVGILVNAIVTNQADPKKAEVG